MNGTLYGTTMAGGLSGRGIVYSISPAGIYKVLYRFRGGSDGSQPWAGVIDVKGTLYGTTMAGGSSNDGTVFALSPSGTETVLHSFGGGSDGSDPETGLTELNGTLYGTTWQGGGTGYYERLGCGIVFSITAAGVEKVLHSFEGGSDGANPEAGLTERNGTLYGTTLNGGSGASGLGTVYSITTAGVEKVLYSFQGGADGADPASGLTNVNGVFYGTTYYGGSASGGCGCGTVFRVSTTGGEKVIYRFAGATSDGANPAAGLLDVNGTLYGTTSSGGTVQGCFERSGCGTVYSVTISGVETLLHAFAGGTDGAWPDAPLTNVKGTLYGTTPHGGHDDTCCAVYGYGTIFALTL